MQRFTRQGLIAIFSLFTFTLIMTAIALNPKWRNQVKSWVYPSDRIILAKASAMVHPKDGPFVVVFKIKEGLDLYLEVFKRSDQSDDLLFLQKIPLNAMTDGYFHFQGNATNLALSDTDNDGHLDILAPTYDDQMTPRLNVYRFNSSLQVFVVAQPE